MKQKYPLLIFLLGVFILFLIPKLDIMAFVFFFISIVIFIEMKWPEKWDKDVGNKPR